MLIFADMDASVGSMVARLEECSSSPPRDVKVEPEDPDDGEISDNTDAGMDSDDN